jgi:putative spermidine/putrescine transport system ATP-binding protein
VTTAWSEEPTSAVERSNLAGATVRIRNLVKHFGKVVAVDDVDLGVNAGEFLTVLGPSGSGKTTILKLLAGFDTPSAGRIELDGEDVAWMPPAERNIGMVFQNYALFPHMTVADNVGYGLKMRGWPAAARRERIDEMLRLVRLEGMGDRQPRQLSGGQQQRVALARALAFGPSVLLMDEPLGALDKALRLEMGEEIRRIHRATMTTVIYVTHDQEEALALSDWVAIMRNGRLVAHGTPQELYRRPPSEFVATFFGGCDLFPVLTIETREGVRHLRLADGVARLPAGDDAGPEERLLAVHPHDLRVEAVGLGDGLGLEVRARVRETLFMGDGAQITCDVAGTEKVVARDKSRLAERVRAGDEVTLVADADALTLIPRDAPD